jgi:hypothetical protein
MKICLRSAARISAERLISVQTDEIDVDTNMAENMGDKLYTGLLASRGSVNQQVKEASRVTLSVVCIYRADAS